MNQSCKHYKLNESYDEAEPCAKCFEDEHVRPIFARLICWIKGHDYLKDNKNPIGIYFNKDDFHYGAAFCRSCQRFYKNL